MESVAVDSKISGRQSLSTSDSLNTEHEVAVIEHTVGYKTRIAVGLALSLFTAFLGVYAFPPYNAWLLGWLFLVPQIIAAGYVLPREAWCGQLSSLLGLGVMYCGIMWSIFWPNHESGVPIYIAFMPIYVALTICLLGGNKGQLLDDGCINKYMTVQCAGFVAIERIRLFMPISGSWGFLGYQQVAVPWLIQPVSLFGMLGLDLLLLLVNYSTGAVCVLLLHKHHPLDNMWDGQQRRIATRDTFKWFKGVMLCLCFWVVCSLILLADETYSPNNESVKVAAVQGTSAEGAKTAAQYGDESWQQLVEGTQMAVGSGASLVVWPERAINFYVEPDDNLTAVSEAWYQQIGRVANESNVWLVAGFNYNHRGESVIAAVSFDPDGRFLGMYYKYHPVLFLGESEQPDNSDFNSYSTPFGRLGTAICYDIDFLDTMNLAARSGAQIVAVPSADWPGIAHLHHTHTVMRAIENRVSVVKTDLQWDSVIVNSLGEVEADCISGSGAYCVLVGEVKAGSGKDGSLFAWTGEVVGVLCIVVYAAVLFCQAFGEKLKLDKWRIVKWLNRHDGSFRGPDCRYKCLFPG